MTDISTLERLTKENPLEYGYWNDLGIEYKKQGRLRDAIVSYLNGVNAIPILKIEIEKLIEE